MHKYTKQCHGCGQYKPTWEFPDTHLRGMPSSSYCGDCSIYIVYALVDPRDSRIHYIGCTQNPKARLAAHITGARSAKRGRRKVAWLNELRRRGLRPLMIEIERVNHWRHVERELFWIEKLAEHGAPLTNCKPGWPVRYYAAYEAL